MAESAAAVAAVRPRRHDMGPGPGDAPGAPGGWPDRGQANIAPTPTLFPSDTGIEIV